MKKTFLLLVWLYMAHQVLGQAYPPLERKIQEGREGEFTLSYTTTSDSLKGFFLITEQLTGKTKLLKASCKFPYRFENNQLQVSGDKIPAQFRADFTFKMLEGETRMKGQFRSENFGAESIEINFEEIKLQKPEPPLAVNPKTETRENKQEKEEQKTEQVFSSSIRDPDPVKQKEKIPAKNDQPKNISLLVPASVNRAQPDTVFAVSFRVQLAASTTPMEIQRLRQLAGLGLPVYEDRIDQYFKYTVGNETSLKAAQDLLNRVAKEHFKKPFIVAYLDKNRVTVQQALDEINRMNTGAGSRK